MPHLLVGCSFTDPRWQKTVPWSVHYSNTFESYIVAQAGMGIKGISTEALTILKQLTDIDKVIIMLPTLWRMDIEIDHESPAQICNAMVPTLYAKNGTWQEYTPAYRKWMISGGLHFEKNKPSGAVFDLLYKYQGFLVLLKEQLRSLRFFLDYCKQKNISYYITAIRDPVDQLQGLDHVDDQIRNMLQEVEYDKWIRFDGQFIDKFLQHKEHPTTEEQKILCQHIIDLTS
jgi:hypothetical protein